MAQTEQVLYQQDATKGHWFASVTYFVTSLSFVAGLMTATKGHGAIPIWIFAFPPVIFWILLWLVNSANKATLTITKSIKGELHVELRTKNKLILQGPPKSIFYWTQIKSNMTHESGIATLLELKTQYGDVIGLTSPTTNEEFDKMENRAMGFEGNFPVYKVKNVGKIIKVLHAEGIPFSFK